MAFLSKTFDKLYTDIVVNNNKNKKYIKENLNLIIFYLYYHKNTEAGNGLKQALMSIDLVRRNRRKELTLAPKNPSKTLFTCFICFDRYKPSKQCMLKSLKGTWLKECGELDYNANRFFNKQLDEIKRKKFQMFQVVTAKRAGYCFPFQYLGEQSFIQHIKTHKAYVDANDPQNLEDMDVEDAWSANIPKHHDWNDDVHASIGYVDDDDFKFDDDWERLFSLEEDYSITHDPYIFAEMRKLITTIAKETKQNEQVIIMALAARRVTREDEEMEMETPTPLPTQQTQLRF